MDFALFNREDKSLVIIESKHEKDSIEDDCFVQFYHSVCETKHKPTFTSGEDFVHYDFISDFIVLAN